MASRNIPGDTNGVTFKLNSGYHPNRHLLGSGGAGEENFQVEVLEELDYRDESDDPPTTKELLEQLRDLLPRARRAPRFCGSNRLHAAEQSDFAQGKQLHQNEPSRFSLSLQVRAQGASALARGTMGNAKDAP